MVETKEERYKRAYEHHCKSPQFNGISFEDYCNLLHNCEKELNKLAQEAIQKGWIILEENTYTWKDQEKEKICKLCKKKFYATHTCLSYRNPEDYEKLPPYIRSV